MNEWRRSFLALCGFLAASVGQPASAGQVVEGLLPGIGPVISIGGVIATGDERSFHDLAERLGHPVVMLSGPGGLVGPAITIGAEIRNRGLTTLVWRETSCASACALIWLAGARRQLGSGGRIGLHAMSATFRDGHRVETHDADWALRSYLTQLGLAMDTTATIVNTPAAMVRWMDTQELDANGIDTEPVN